MNVPRDVARLTVQVTVLVVAGLLAVFLSLNVAVPALASTIGAVSRDDAGARTLADSMVKSPETLQGARFATVPSRGTPNGTSNALSFFPTDGDTLGIMTTGNVAFAGADNTSGGAGEALGGSGGSNASDPNNTAFDVSVLELDLVAPAGANCLRLDFAFYSEEYPEYVGSSFNDAFIAELDRSTWKTSNSVIVAPDNFAFDEEGAVISINSTGRTGMNDVNPGGTTYDGSTTLLEAATTVTPGAHKLYLSVFDQGDQALDSAALMDNIRFEKVSDPAIGCKPGAQPVDGRTPLIIVPGAGGSELVDAGANDKELWTRAQELYDSSTDGHLRDLKLDENGNSQGGSDVRAKDIARRLTVNVLGGLIPQTVDNYSETIETLEAAGYQEGKDLFVFPYDFRKEVEGTKNYEGQTLIEKIDEVLADTSASQVDVMAHSMGGLVTLDALRDPESKGKVRKAITLGTPVLGATKGLGLLEYQMPCFVETPYIPICLSDKAVVQEILDTFPGGHLLLPSPNFDAAEGAPLVIDHASREDGRTGEQGYDEWSAILREDPARNDRLIDYAKMFHEANDDLRLADSSVKLIRVVGDSVDTPNQIREYEYYDCGSGLPGDNPCIRKTGHEIVKGNGDVTVPKHSADLFNPETGFDKRGANDYGTISNIYAHDVDHEGLYKDDNVLAFANAYFGGKQSFQAANFAASRTVAPEPSPREPQDPRTTEGEDLKMSAQAIQSTEDVEPASLGEEFGLSSTSEPFGGVELETRGPVRGFVEDESGNVLGNYPGQPGDALFQTIPGGTYNALSETQTFFLNEAGSFTGNLEVTGEEGSRLRVRTYADDEMNGQAVFSQLDAPVGAKLQLGLTMDQDLGSLRLLVDNEGDGTVDEKVAPDSIVMGSSASETDPPTTTATVKTIPIKRLGGDNEREDDDDEASRKPKEASVTFAAEDGSDGSGVASTYYFVEGETGVRTYGGPFAVALGKTVSFWSVDQAGNAERLQKMLIDDAPDTLQNAESVTPKARLLRYIDPRGDEDWFGFEADGRTEYRLQLHGLPADYDLELYDESGKKDIVSYKRGKRSEQIRLEPVAGRYYVRVVGYAGAWSGKLPYQLKLDKLGARQEDDRARP